MPDAVPLGSQSMPAPDPSGHAPAAPVADSPAPETGHASAETPSPETPEAAPQAPARRFKSWEEAESGYTQAQSAMTRLTQALRQMGVQTLGSLKEQLTLLDQLRENPRFREWAEGERTRIEAGSEDPRAQQVLRFVERISEQKARELVEPLLQERVAQRTETVFKQMDTEFPGWETYRPKMRQLLAQGKSAGWFAPSVESDFDFEFVKGLYLQAAFPQLVSQKAVERLREKREVSTESTPGTAASQVTGKPAQSLEEAFAAAKRSLVSGGGR